MSVLGDRTARRRADARELAVTPPPDPYRGQLADPYCDQPVADDVRLFVPAGYRQLPPVGGARPGPWGPGMAPRPGSAPAPAVFAGVTGLVLAVLLGLLGMLLLAVVSLSGDVGAPDRSFYRGADASYVVLALVNFLMMAGCLLGAIGLLSGRVAGRVLLTGSGWAAVIVSLFWWQGPHSVNPTLPVVMAGASLAMLIAAYQPSVTHWLGVRPPPQPTR